MADDFKWFGEGFDGFPKRLPEDTVEYALLLIDGALEAKQKIATLRTYLQEISALTKDFLKNYIWQRDPFKLELVYDEDAGSWTLKGSTNFGDSIADEWLIVYLLVEASKKYPELWIRVHDNDGEFLLIEAAGVLPKWLNPEIATNRVWVHAGEIRLIPLVAQTPLATRSPSLRDAVIFIEKSSQLMTRSPALEKEALHRIKKYPGAIAEHFHQSLVVLPRKLAHVLHRNPAYISPAIEAFYLRDPVALKPLLNPNPSSLAFPPSDLICTSIRFTRVGFAQIKSQEFGIPPAWIQCTNQIDAKDRARALVGLKLTCGFEMLLSDKLHQDKRAVREIQLLLEDLDNGDDSLPDDKEVSQWSKQDDNESWMDINFDDFEKELGGKDKAATANDDGFGDKAAQENLRRLVSRFEDFINDEDAGLEGAEMDDDYDDDDDGTSNSEDDEDEEGDVEFDEEKFTQMMREMMGLRSEDQATRESDDEEDVQKAIEAELRQAGVLETEPNPKKKAIQGPGKGEEEDEDAEVDIDFNLAKNMLEAFKSQGGMSGPAGNLMGLLGVRLPPDKDEKDAL